MYEAIEITEHDSISIIAYQMLIRVCVTENDPEATDITQNVAVRMRVRSTVNIALCLIPNNRARSLSTLMAVSVNKDTEHNAKLDMLTAFLTYRQRLQCS